MRLRADQSPWNGVTHRAAVFCGANFTTVNETKKNKEEEGNSIMAVNDIQDRIARYLDDAIALEASGITGLKDMISEATDPQDAAMFQLHLTETERQKERLEARLAALGGTSNKLKDVLNKIGIAATDLLHGGKDPGDKATRNLIQAYAIENLEVATYESLIAAATQVGDTETAALAREIQAEEKATANKLFPRIAPMAQRAVVEGVQT
jgi:ferritin-like metal-binding protein YciE